MEVKMAATTCILQLILKKLSLGHLTELFHRDINTTDMICNQQGTAGHDEFAVTIMFHIRRAHRMRCTGICHSQINTGRSFGRGLHNRGDFLYAFSQP